MKDGYYVVKPWDVMLKQYGENEAGITVPNGFTNLMEKKLPKGRIILIENDAWKPCYSVSEEMFLGPYIPYGTEVEVSDSPSPKEWCRDFFVTYIPGEFYSISTSLGAYKYVRLIEEPEIKISIEINGQPAKLSDISDETLKKIKETEK